ncbi:MAG: pyrroloquinoline quinone biosynthesis protein PqqB [Gammaproteobacteria bacterium]|nr:hypothetical protein [Woeseia sp.]MBT8435067.1 pyrroloquinoline quinone biosynthesis protein PqqB [Gammaproteobacteria bacterium]
MKKIIILLTYVIASIFTTACAAEKAPYIYVLGVVQDAGYPQTACYEKHCMPGWENPLLRRGAASLGVIDPSNDTKYMFEATPNFPEQLYKLEKVAPSSKYTLNGVFITHAHIGHYAGLMYMGHEAAGMSNVPVYVMPKMKDYLINNGPWSQLVKYKNINLMPLQHNKPESLGQLKITPFLVPHRDEYSETVGYKISGPNKSAIFIPDINKWHEWETDLADAVKEVDYAFLDATFYDDGELPGRDMSKVPHPFVAETMKTLEHLSDSEKNKVWFIHLNHTNPLLNLESKERKFVKSQGFNISVEGLKVEL